MQAFGLKSVIQGRLERPSAALEYVVESLVRSHVI